MGDWQEWFWKALPCLLLLILQKNWNHWFYEKSMESSSPGTGEEIVPWVIWCHGNTIWWPKSPDGAIVHTILCVCDHRLCFEGTLKGFSVGWRLWGDLLSAFLPPGPMQTLGLSSPWLIIALLAPTPKWGLPPCHFNLHRLRIKNKWNTLCTENPSF